MFGADGEFPCESSHLMTPPDGVELRPSAMGASNKIVIGPGTRGGLSRELSPTSLWNRQSFICGLGLRSLIGLRIAMHGENRYHFWETTHSAACPAIYVAVYAALHHNGSALPDDNSLGTLADLASTRRRGYDWQRALLPVALNAIRTSNFNVRRSS